MGLQVDNVVAGYYGDIVVLQGVSINAQTREVTAIIGPNGAGKSTLLKVIYGFLKPRKGRILYNGQDITGKRPSSLLNLGIAYVPQERTIFPSLTVEENLELGAWTIRKRQTAVKRALEVVYDFLPALKRYRYKKARMLSGGTQRMLEIGRALMTKPKLLLLDEPTAQLAPKLAKEIYGVIEQLKEANVTIILVDQNVKQCIEVADYIYVLEMGRNKVDGPKEKFEKQLRNVVKGWLIA